MVGTLVRGCRYATSWPDLDLTFDLAIVTLSSKILNCLVLVLYLHMFSFSSMLFSLFKHYLDLYISDTTLKVSWSLYCFTTSICHCVKNYFPRLWVFSRASNRERSQPCSGKIRIKPVKHTSFGNHLWSVHKQPLENVHNVAQNLPVGVI